MPATSKPKRRFKDYQLHLEWRIPDNITGSGQARGNSGVFLASTGPGDAGYELQILDSYNNKTYVNGHGRQPLQTGHPPRQPRPQTRRVANLRHRLDRPPFNPDGTLKTPPTPPSSSTASSSKTTSHLQGETRYIGKPFYKAFDTAPIKLQAHGDPSNPISFRNIWVRELH